MLLFALVNSHHNMLSFALVNSHHNMLLFALVNSHHMFPYFALSFVSLLYRASNTAPARLLQKRVWTDLATLPALHEYERQKMIVRHAHELAKNASEIAHTPGRGWQSRGLTDALLGGNALYLLQKLLLKPIDWERNDFASGSEANAPNWVQDRPNGRRLDVGTVAVVLPVDQANGHILGITNFVQGLAVGCCTIFTVLQMHNSVMHRT